MMILISHFGYVKVSQGHSKCNEQIIPTILCT